MSLKRRRLQDEAATLTAQIEELRAVTPDSDEQAASIEEQITAAAARCEQVTNELRVENEIDAKVKALRSVVVDDCEARSVIETAENKGIVVNHTADKYLRSLARGEVRAWSEGGENLGAELVPSEVYSSVINVLNRTSVGARLAFVVSTLAKKITLPKLGSASASFYAEAAEVSPSNIATTGVDVNLFGIRSILDVSNDMIEDAVTDIGALVTAAFGSAFASKIDHAWLQGDGTAGVDGLVGEVDSYVAVGSAKATTAGDLAELIGKIDPLAMNTAWVVSPEGYGALMAANAGTGTMMLADASLPTVFGRPVYTTNQMPAGTLALYGDFSMSTAVAVKASGLRVEALREVRSAFDQVRFIGKQRVGITNHAPEFVAKLIID
ncbi:MAG: phage major capsid protein [Planctomycetia bacterium]|nr:phage major capsid protein [Planctomycetia bacterium]